MKRLGTGLLLGVAVFGVLHELGRRWGATPEEVARRMPGDDVVPRAQVQTTHAITIDAAPEKVWPWLVQMGYHRAGWYTYPWVDRYLWRIDNPSADRILADLQLLGVGDTVPDGEPGTAFYRVEMLEPPRLLVLHSTSHVPQGLKDRMSVDWTWTFELRRAGSASARLILRVRGTFRPWWARVLFEGVIVPSDFVMARSMLRGIARRAEGRPTCGDRREAARRLEEVTA